MTAAGSEAERYAKGVLKRMKRKSMIAIVCIALAVMICMGASAPDYSAKDGGDAEKAPAGYTLENILSIAGVKENIYNGMINSVDFYDAVEGSFTTTFIRAGEDVTISFKVDIPQQVACESVKGSVEDLQAACIDEMLYSYNASNGNYLECYYASPLDASARSGGLDNNICLPHAQKAAFSIGGEAIYDRVVTQSDGERGYYYRPDITNTAYASQCIFPQSLGMALLPGMDNWDISGVRQYLGRQAVVLSGTVTDPDYAQKISSDSFEMTVDMNTGVLLEFRGFSGGELTQHIEMKSISFLTSGADNGIRSAAEEAVKSMEIY